MRLTTLTLHNFRNHLLSSFEFDERTNILFGDNGQGKTNVIEAISFLCLTKSFYASGDNVVLNFQELFFEVSGNICLDNGEEETVRVAYDRAENDKVYAINKHDVEKFSSVIGRFPVVICSPEHAPITNGGPSERRKFIDFVLSQTQKRYVQDLLEYRRVIKHRNKLLLDRKLLHRDVESALIPWDEQLVQLGSRLMYARQQFVKEFQRYIADAYHHLIGHEEEPSLSYVPSVHFEGEHTVQQFEEKLREALIHSHDEERRVGSTSVGPHRDEILFMINGYDLRKFASQGQHKTYLVALKIGEFFYLKERHGESPIFLLDDIFSELDEHRAGQLLDFVSDLSQTFITTTNLQPLKNITSRNEKSRLFVVRNGTIVEEHAAEVS